ncbi:protein rad9 [Diplogelasinospora grovesii]|uniref:Sister chromatid cohesion protein n=1 Tax=Diplogelasinospora grovesii TaxID=303347 RepID=A0AAN6S4C8_9PEZI|nr:protein rad9 [Diplogelasinospora grovesii]
MANPRASYPNGPPNSGAHHGSRQPALPSPPAPPALHPSQGGQYRRFDRPIYIGEALPLTPFTFIVPLEPGVIRTPSFGSAPPAPSLNDLIPSQDFDALNVEARISGLSSKRLQQAVGQVQQLLERANVTEFKFKTGPTITNTGNSVETPSRLASGLSPFSRMVYERAPVSFRYPTPDTPTANVKAEQPTTPVAPPVHAQSSPQIKHKAEHSKQGSNINTTKNQKAHAQNSSRIEIHLPTKGELEAAAAAYKTNASLSAPSPGGTPTPVAQASPAPYPEQPTRPALVSPAPFETIEDSVVVNAVTSASQPPSSSQKAAISVELPSAAKINKSEYLVVPDGPDELDEPINYSQRKRKRSESDEDDIYGGSLDLRQRAHTAFHELRQFFRHVFEAEDYAAAHQAGNDVVTLTPENGATLTIASQIKAHTLLAKAISLNCFRKVPLEDLLRLNRLCEGALKQAESLDIKIEESWSGSDVEQWLQQLPLLDAAIRAARTLLRGMCGERKEVELYSENTIEQCLNLIKRITDGIIIPVAELRSTSASIEVFKTISSHKKRIASLFTDCQKLFTEMSTLIAKVDTSESVSNTLEFTASQLIFMETAHAEKDSPIDTQKFDGLRLVAMDMLSQIFLRNTSQRYGIFNEILTSLEKLPLGKRARTFKLVDGSSIQPVSALIMRLVQTAAGKTNDTKRSNRTIEMDEDEDELAADGDNRGSTTFSILDEDHGASQHQTAIRELDTTVSPLVDTAQRDAKYVVDFIVGRASKSTKSGDTPYRNLLDLFVEDFATCLDNPDWPAAELFLRLLMMRMRQIVENAQSPAPSKNMALELFGAIGAAISKLRGHVRKTANSPEARNADELGRYLADLAHTELERRSGAERLVTWTGPYRATLEYLEGRFREDPHLASAITFLVSDWASKVCDVYDSDKYDDDTAPDRETLGRLAYRLRSMIQDRQWLSKEYSFKAVLPGQARLSYAIALLRSPLCEAYGVILNILLASMSSDQPTVRSKSLKSINQVLETDPSILDGDSVVVRMILVCTSDSSTQVRDSALGLVGKCISLRPALEKEMTSTVVDRFMDSGPGVRKRAMKLAKDIYLRNSSKAIRSVIANGLLHRVQDPEESVRELARQMIEEIWFTPFHEGENSAVSQMSLAEHVTLMVQTAKQGNISNVLDKVLQSMLAPSSKTAQASLEVCRKLVAKMFDLVDNPDSSDPSVPSGRDALQVLMIFAKAEASLFTFEQLRLLKPVITNVGTSDEIAVSRAVVVIYRRVLPQLSSAHAQFLADVRNALIVAVSKATRTLLDDIMACIWIICTLLENSEQIARLVSSALGQIEKMRVAMQNQPLNEQAIRQFDRYAIIVGMAGKHCDLDSQQAIFKARVPRWNGDSVPKLMLDVLVPFAAPSQHMVVRKAALDAVGLVCQAWPKNYVSPNVYTTFQRVFDEQNPVLEAMILRSLKEFLLIEETRSEQASQAPVLNGNNKPEKKRELTVIGGTNFDDVASATTHRFLREITRIAMSTQDEHAFLAVEVLASINRQGLVHPKETGVTFITLETSSNPRISELAFMEHKALHAKHETVVEREYVKAVQSAFAYQRDVAKDARGATADPFTPKLHLMMEVLKISKSKNRQKFLEKFVAQVDFGDVSKLEISEEIPPHVQYARFIVENIAFFEYVTVGELHSTVAAMEKLVASNGAAVAQAIESEVFQVRMDAIEANPTAEQQEAGFAPPPRPEVEYKRLRQLAAGAMTLLAVWEVRTHLRRLYGMGTGRRESKGKPQAKDLTKTPIKVPSVSGDKVWEELATIMTALTSRERMMETCKAFVELMNVDKEFLVQAEDDDMNGNDPGTPENPDDEEQDQPSATRGRKRKASNANAPAGKKKRARSTSQPRKRGRPKKQHSNESHDADGEAEDDWL